MIVVSSVLIFVGFSMISVNKNLGKLSENTFLIYLLYVEVWESVKIVGRRILFKQEETIGVLYLLVLWLLSCFLMYWRCYIKRFVV